MSKDWIESMAYEMAEVFQEKMEIAYQEGQKERNEPTTNDDIEKLRADNEKLRIALDEAREAVNHNSKLVEEERLKHELYRNRGEADGLKYAIRCFSGYKEGQDETNRR